MAEPSTLLDVANRVEELFVQQLDRIAFHYNEQDNDYRTQETQLSRVMLDNTVPNEKQIDCAKRIVQLSDRYLETFVKPLEQISSEIESELLKCEAVLTGPEHIKDPDIQRWLALSRALNAARRGATDAIIRQVTFDKRIPTMVIKGGRSTDELSPEESQQFQQELMDYATLTSKCREDNDRIQAEREPLVQRLLPNAVPRSAEARQVSTGRVVEPARSRNPLEPKGWYRFVKVAYIVLWITAALLTGMMTLVSIDAAAVTAIVSVVLLVVLRKAFFYVALGRTTAVEPGGSGYADIDDLRADFANVQASDPDLYAEFITPAIENWQRTYGRRIPLEAMNSLQQRIGIEMEAVRQKKKEIVAKAAREGVTVKIADLRARFERDKANYAGPHRTEYARELDRLLMSLEAKYGTEIPADEADDLADRLDDKARAQAGASYQA
jgi:hypothetical protein